MNISFASSESRRKDLTYEVIIELFLLHGERGQRTSVGIIGSMRLWWSTLIDCWTRCWFRSHWQWPSGRVRRGFQFEIEIRIRFILPIANRFIEHIGMIPNLHQRGKILFIQFQARSSLTLQQMANARSGLRLLSVEFERAPTASRNFM